MALIVSLSDAFALLDHRDAAPQLRQALDLKHRRVQTEAAAALARIGDELGKTTLIELANQPVSRMRVLAYAEELDFLDEISLELRGEIAVAESHLAIWLSEPAQMGLAPSSIELFDNREMLWPSYEHPVQCYLFTYSYGTGPQSLSNIAICGPLTHAFAADLRPLSTDDIYAAFAGWQTIHQEIFQTTLEKSRTVAPGIIAQLESDLKHTDDGDSATIETVGNFFGQWVLVASGIRDSQRSTLIVDQRGTTWIDAGNPDAPIDWSLAWSIWQGRQFGHIQFGNCLNHFE